MKVLAQYGVSVISLVFLLTACSDGGARRSPTVPSGGGPGFQELQASAQYKKFVGQVNQKEISENEVIVAPEPGEQGIYLISYNARRNYQFTIPETQLECRYKYNHLKRIETVRENDGQLYLDIKKQPIEAELIYPKLAIQRALCQDEFSKQVEHEEVAEIPSRLATFKKVRNDLLQELMLGLSRCDAGEQLLIGKCKNVEALLFEELANDQLKKDAIEYVLDLSFITDKGTFLVERSISLNFSYFSFGSVIRHRGPTLLELKVSHPLSDVSCLDFSLNVGFSYAICGTGN
ncbi:MAG: hypothetical protein HN509_18190 [Halobacteriovoraceae bacterium]|jgi:hypothetical protein|nr:hypothetical protein [Halobacteriovoraceae bacterium]MBT5094649.1 hypothetical protein [Halobacteriovoraceae bacterium]